MTEHDGIDGTDNVQPLFSDRPSAAPLPPQSDIVEVLEEYMLGAVSGKVTGLILLAFNQSGGFGEAIAGKVPLQSGITSLEKMKFGILLRDFTANQLTK